MADQEKPTRDPLMTKANGTPWTTQDEFTHRYHRSKLIKRPRLTR